MGKWSSAANEVFLQALEHDSPGRRRAYLDEACGADKELRAEVDSLLTASAQVGDFLESPALGSASIVPGACGEEPGMQIGPYKLMELIGEGGFGNVYLAEQQEPVRRKVALKIIKLGMDTRQVIARFEAERQALALMEHSHIAKVLDAGSTETGRPYFVMELVRGVPITKYCDAHNLPTHERLQLFLNVCRAVQHAHQKGIIHRDLKPNNVLVTQQDGRPAPKIIDFGVAKATQQRLTERTLFTEHRQLVGTPEYMSPEQATFCETDVDTRSDIYALGVLLYELLVGTPPFDADAFRTCGYDEICRIIRESQPPTPSRRLSTIDNATMADISKHRYAEPAALRKLLRGDLDCIVMKCMEKQRTRRYETAHSLARDVERHLHDEPVQARPPSTRYQLEKFVRKYRGPVAAGCAVGASLIFGLLMTSLGFLRAERERQTANSQLYVSDINSAYHAWEEGNVDRVRELLERHVPQPAEKDLRGFEWRYLWGEYQRTQQIPTVKHGPITGVAFSPDGTVLASASWDSTVKLWEVATRTELQTLQHESGALCVAFSPDGSILASGSEDQTIRLWDPVTGIQLARLPHTQNVTAVAFSPDGNLLAAGCGGRIAGEIKLWNVATHAKVATLSGHTASVTTVAFSRNGKTLASGSRDRTIKLWDVESGVEIETLRGSGARISSVAFSPCGDTLAVGGHDSNVRLWNTATRQFVGEFPESIGQVTCLAFSPISTTLAVGADDSRVRLWDVASRRTTIHHTGHSFGIDSIAFSPDGTSLATGSGDGTVQITNIPQVVEATSESGHSEWFTHLAVSPADGATLAVAFGEMSTEAMTGELVLWDVAKREARFLSGGKGGPVESVAFSPDGQLLAASQLKRASSSSVVILWDVASSNKLQALEGHSGSVYALAFSPDGKTLASGDWGRIEGGLPRAEDGVPAVRLWDVPTGKPRKSLSTARFGASSIAFSPDGKFLAIGGGDWGDGEIKLWDTDRDVGPVTLARTSRCISDAAFSPDGRLLAFADYSGAIRLWRVADRKEEIAFNAHSFWLYSIAFSPDGKTLATGSWDQTVKLWCAVTGGELATFKTGVPIHSVRFFPDGNTLAAGCNDKSVILWHVESETEVLRSRSE